MKTIYYKYFWLLLCGFLILPILGFANDTLLLRNSSSQKNLKQFSRFYTTESELSIFSFDSLEHFQALEDERSFLYLNFDVGHCYSKFHIKNTTNHPKELILTFSYPFLEYAELFSSRGSSLISMGQIGIKTKSQPSDRTWKLPIYLGPGQGNTFYLAINKSKGIPLATDIMLHDMASHNKAGSFQNISIGAYLGLILLSFFFAVFLFSLTNKHVFLLYSFYLVTLVLFMGSYLGYAHILLPPEQLVTGRVLYVISIELSTIVFVLFAQEILMAKKYLPKLKRNVEIVIACQIGSRLFFHYLGNDLYIGYLEWFMKLWYLTIIFLITAVVVEIIIYINHNRKVGSYFALSYLFMTLGSVQMVLHHSFGLLNSSMYGLPIIFYASALEVLFLTITLVIIVGQIYQDRNAMADKIVLQQQKFLNAFLQGQEEERKRMGGELHDNVGSKIANLKRLFSAKYTDKKMQSEFDEICEDVREVAHRITPSEISLVGLAGAIDELLEAVEKPEELKINFNTYQFPEKLNESISTHLFRIVQELLQNVLKHANATVVDVQLFGHKNSITLSFEDDGYGMPEKNRSMGLGLRNIQSRVAQMNGKFLFDSVSEKGTSVLVTIPTKYT